MRFSLLSILSFSFFSGQLLAADGIPPLPRGVAVLGDSLSEGMLSEFSLEEPPTFYQFIEMLSYASQGTPLIDTFRKHYAKIEHSWATGVDDSDLVLSHAERLRLIDNSIQSFNFAISGSESKDLPNQADTLLQTEYENGTLIDYILILIGGNDLRREKVSDMTPVWKYSAFIEQTMRKILDSNPHRSFLLVAIPNVHKVFEESAEYTAFRFWTKTYNCGEMRGMIYGNAAFFNPEEKDEYEASKIILSQYNQALKDLADRLSQEYPTAYFKYVSEYENPPTGIKSLSIDCFHPSEWGQASLAEFTWQNGFWPDLVSTAMLLGQSN